MTSSGPVFTELCRRKDSGKRKQSHRLVSNRFLVQLRRGGIVVVVSSEVSGKGKRADVIMLFQEPIGNRHGGS